MPVKVTVSGPLFTPAAATALDDMRDEIAGRLAAEGRRRVLATLDSSLRNPTGAYRRRVTQYGPVSGQARLHDQQAIYGPWLNGTGSRNATTRFKGYGHFRKTYEALQQAARPLAQQIVAEYVAELGG
jgi:hypothetical protein